MSSSYEELLERKNFLPYHFDHLTSRMIQIAKDELNENENNRSSSIEELRKLIFKEKNLQCRTDDELLLQFLRARRFNVKKAFARVQSFFQVASKSFSDVYANMDVEIAKKAFRSGFCSHLPYRDKDGAAVVFIKMSNWNTDEIDAFGALNCVTAAVLAAVDYPATQVCGLKVVADIRGTTLQHMRSLTPRFLYLLSKGLRDTLPIQFKGIHLINSSSIFRCLWAVIHIFLSEKMRKRVHFHDDSMESLHKFISREILPKEYGGDYPKFDPIELGSAELEKFFPKYLELARGGYIKN
ncbi:Clavesin-2 like protein [Argiope bruennichi]|uniref:Clavesin-2 like protein n=1 Tax=Argiope bruennichi TaxID=94029 RepID=A0A8T0ES38_ARGBR|nr:Clavesin-2 like protein [Argiope bruennichi]